MFCGIKIADDGEFDAVDGPRITGVAPDVS